jgi:hypothetical protein
VTTIPAIEVVPATWVVSEHKLKVDPQAIHPTIAVTEFVPTAAEAEVLVAPVIMAM